jgi:hypothetical protein
MRQDGAAGEGAQGFCSQRLEQVFARCFGARWRTRLVGGADEPFYQPAAGVQEEHLLYYRHDYFASALHEVAHWCIAGERRRQQADFGYWYAPDGRSPAQQAAFEKVESKPQALEWLFARACGYPFCISVDNLGAPGGEPDTGPFKRQVLAQAQLWQRQGLPRRGGQFFAALATEFATGLQPEQLELELAGLAG